MKAKVANRFSAESRAHLDNVHHLLRRAYQRGVSVFTEYHDDLTTQQSLVLRLIDLNPGVEAITLAPLIALERATLGVALERLEKGGLIRRTGGDADRRVKHLHITPLGRKKLNAALAITDDFETTFQEPLTPKEVAQLVKLLKKLSRLDEEEI